MNKDYAAVTEKYLSALTNQTSEAIAEIFADNAIVEDPVGSKPYEGIEAIEKLFEGVFNAGIKAEASGPARIAGNSVAFPFKLTTPGENAVQVDIIDVFDFNDEGKVISMKAYWGEGNQNPV